MTEEEVKQKINHCYSALSKREVKWRRNFNRYMSNSLRSEDIKTIYGQQPYGFYLAGTGEDDLGCNLSINVLRSCVDTLTSKIAQLKLRPFPNPANGTFKVRMICRELQKFFDWFYENQNVYKLGAQAVRHALIMEYGAIWYDPDNMSINRLLPTDVYVDPAEYNIDKLTYAIIDQWYVPVSAITSKVRETIEKKESNPCATVHRVIFFDLVGGQRWTSYDGRMEPVTKGPKHMPVSIIWYNEPIKGFMSTSFMDQEYSQQLQLDDIATRIHAAIATSPINSVFIPTGTGIKKSMLSNQAGAVYGYEPIPGIGTPVQVATPPPFDAFWLDLAKFIQQNIYADGGVSMLSAAQIKPAGVDSGKALDTLQDVESDRFQTFVDQVQRFYLDLAVNICLNSPADEPILPNKKDGGKTWGDIQDVWGEFSLQFGSASALSREPAKKMEEVQKLIDMNLVPSDMVPEMLQFPDLEKLYSVTAANYDDCEAIIERVVETGETDFYEVVDINVLYKFTANQIMRLDAVNEDREVIEKLVDFLKSIKMKIDALNKAANPLPPAPAPSGNVGQPPQAVPQGGPPPKAQVMSGPNPQGQQ